MTTSLRERPDRAVHASRTDGRRLGATLAAAIGVGVLFSVIGAFGSAGLPFPVRTVFMVAIALATTGLALAAFALTARIAWLAARWWAHGLAATALMTLPAAFAVWGALQFVQRPAPPLSATWELVPVSAATSLFFCLWGAYERRRRLRALAARPPAPAAPAAPRFADRLPPKLRGAEVWAVEAEDHYLRLHTSKGQDLILLRLSDAIAELDGLDGAQTHRSWWVAREAVVEVRRLDGRAALTLKNGATAPVSRTYARSLRARGWL